MNTLIIGSTGFIGRALTRKLVALDIPTFGFDTAQNIDSDANFALCDIARQEPQLPPGIDTVIYLAQSPAYRTFPSDAAELFAVNVTGALRAADLARRTKARAFIYASTGTIYAPTFDPIPENHPVRRDHPYALSKIHAEEALALIPDLQTCCIRLFGVFGPGQRGMMVPSIISRIKNKQPVTIEPHPLNPDDQQGLRISITYIDDVVNSLIAIARLMHEGAPVPFALNLAAETPVSIRSLATTIASALNTEPLFNTADQPRTGDYIADVRALQLLCHTRFTPFHNAIDTTLALHA